MNKDEMIKDKEQMARIIAFDLCPQKRHKELWGEEAKCYADNNFGDCTKIKEVVDKLYDDGYRKVADDDDEIVESMKTYERARQETAREIIDLIVDESGVDLLGGYYKLPLSTYNKIKRVYGVEVEE